MLEMIKVQYFKSTRKTHRFNENQKVWISFNYANHLSIYFRFRGKGRWVGGIIGKFHSSVGEIKTIEVEYNFAKRFINII
jgi:hypothetical protein